jgi:flavin reductase (DIM6/NTAB) family NADH-FMN oxidoreductase RutF
MNDPTLSDVAVALGRVASGLFVVTSRNAQGEETAFLASWVMQAGFEPPSLSIAVGQDRAALSFVQEPGSSFVVSVIAESEKGQVGPFAKGIAPAVDALADAPVERTPSGLAAVEGCLAWMECRTLDHGRSGDHVIVIGEIIDARGGRDDTPAIHLRKNGLGY